LLQKPMPPAQVAARLAELMVDRPIPERSDEG
jgi:hypothetical protein